MRGELWEMYKMKPKLPFQSAGHRLHTAAAHYSWQAVRRVARASMSGESANAIARLVAQYRNASPACGNSAEFLKEVRVGFVSAR